MHADVNADDVAAMNERKSKNKKKKSEPDPNQKMGRCEICGSDFPSRSKLFDHIKATGHAKLKNAPASEDSSSKQKKQKKKKASSK